MTFLKTRHLKTYLLIGVMVIAGPLGNVLLSKGMKQTGRLAIWPPTEALHTVLRVFGTPSIWLGVASLLTFFLANSCWCCPGRTTATSSRHRRQVMALPPCSGTSCWGRPVSPLRWLGIAIICLGVLVVGQSSPRSLERSPAGVERS